MVNSFLTFKPHSDQTFNGCPLLLLPIQTDVSAKNKIKSMQYTENEPVCEWIMCDTFTFFIKC